MEIQTFMLKENEELAFDGEVLESWKETCRELQLEGQLALVKTAASPVPYLYLNSKLLTVFRFCAPVQVKLREYKKGPIPLEVLETVRYVEKEGHFTELQVWYDDKSPDPILIGMKEKDAYAIARWGAENMSLAGMEEEARKRCYADTKIQLEKKAIECKGKLAALDSVVEERMNGAYFWI